MSTAKSKKRANFEDGSQYWPKNELKIRLELAKMIGYDHVLPPDPDAFSKMAGAGRKYLPDGADVDVVQHVREARGL